MAVYRLPFPAEANQSTWNVGGNWDQGHHQVGQMNNPTDEQAYAFDIGHETGGKILAARAGVVIDLEDKWADDTHPADGTPGAGNYIWIRHGDGTMAAYCHLKRHSIRVAQDQYVLQGSWIAQCDNTGVAKMVPQMPGVAPRRRGRRHGKRMSRGRIPRDGGKRFLPRSIRRT